MNAFEQVAKYSEQMLDHAQAGQWDHVAEAEGQRRELLNQLFANPGDNQGVPEINRTIEKIIEINKRLESIAIDARDKTRLELEKIRGGRNAVNVYTQHL